MNSNVRYHIKIKTANGPVSGVEGPIFFKFVGDQGAAKPIELGDDTGKQSPFSRNTTSQFSVGREDVGDIEYLEIWHNCVHDWEIEKIEVVKGNDQWIFTTKDPIRTQRDVRGGLTTKLQGEHLQVSTGANRFHMAAKGGRIEELESIIEKREYAIDDTDQLGRTAAMYACLYGQTGALEILLEFNADIARKDTSGKNCLHHACLNHAHNMDIISLLLENAPGSGEEKDGAGAEDDDDTPIIRYIRQKDGFGKTAMHYAASYGFKKVIELLHGHYRTAIRDKDNTAQTPLHCAAIQGQTAAAIALIKFGADVTSLDRQDKTFLHHAAAAGHADFLQSILTHEFSGKIKKQLNERIEAVDDAGRTPLLAAAAGGHLAALKALYKLGAKIYQLDADKSNALILAARCGQDRMLSFLAQKLDVNAVNDFDINALHAAVTFENAAGARWLVKNGVDITAAAVSGETALDMARKRDNANIVRLLENASAAFAKSGAATTGTKKKKPAPKSTTVTGFKDPSDDLPMITSSAATAAPSVSAEAEEETRKQVETVMAEQRKLLMTIEKMKGALTQMKGELNEYKQRYGPLREGESNASDALAEGGDCSVM